MSLHSGWGHIRLYVLNLLHEAEVELPLSSLFIFKQVLE